MKERGPLVPPGSHRAAGALVDGAARRGLEIPALLLLELALPFRVLIQQALLLAQPLLSPWAGDRVYDWAGLLDDEDALAEARRRLALARRRGGS
jgi:hypothetical protein